MEKIGTYIKVGVIVISLLASVGVYMVFKPNINPTQAKQEVERILDDTQSTFKKATGAF